MAICDPCNEEFGKENMFIQYFHSENKENLQFFLR
jgi:hypothetical protein